MRRILTITLALICTLGLLSPVQAQLSGNKKITKEIRRIAPFSAIELTGRMEVMITQGNEYTVAVETDENLQENITTDVRNNTLRISAKARGYSSLIVHITLVDIVYIDADRAHVKLLNQYKTKKLTVGIKGGGSFLANDGFVSEDLTVNLSGGSSAGGLKPFTVYNKLMVNSISGSSAELNVTTDKVEVEATTTALIKLEGKANELIAVATTAARIDAFNFIVARASVKSTTAARIQVHVTERLDGVKKSTGRIEVLGNPPKQTLL